MNELSRASRQLLDSAPVPAPSRASRLRMKAAVLTVVAPASAAAGVGASAAGAGKSAAGVFTGLFGKVLAGTLAVSVGAGGTWAVKKVVHAARTAAAQGSAPSSPTPMARPGSEPLEKPVAEGLVAPAPAALAARQPGGDAASPSLQGTPALGGALVPPRGQGSANAASGALAASAAAASAQLPPASDAEKHRTTGAGGERAAPGRPAFQGQASTAQAPGSERAPSRGPPSAATANTRGAAGVTGPTAARADQQPSAEAQSAGSFAPRGEAAALVSAVGGPHASVAAAPPPRLEATTDPQLREELTFLRAAMAQRDAADWRALLATVDAYDARFPSGKLALEAKALRVLGLCGVSRAEEARALAGRLAAAAPGSPTLKSLAGSCAAP